MRPAICQTRRATLPRPAADPVHALCTFGAHSVHPLCRGFHAAWRLGTLNAPPAHPVAPFPDATRPSGTGHASVTLCRLAFRRSSP